MPLSLRCGHCKRSWAGVQDMSAGPTRPPPSSFVANPPQFRPLFFHLIIFSTLFFHWLTFSPNSSYSRLSTARPTCSCTRRSTSGSRSRTSVQLVEKHSPTAPICRSTRESTWGSSRTVVRSANASSPSSPTCSSTSGLTPGTSRTSAGYQVGRLV